MGEKQVNGVIEKIKSIDKKQLFFIILLFLVAFGLRADLFKYKLLFEFDTYYHARIVEDILTQGSIPAKDDMAYYQLGYADNSNDAFLFWHISAWVYRIVSFGAPYDKDLLIEVVKWLPALFGALTAVALFFLGKEMFGEKHGKAAGFAMALSAAVIPAFVYRTMAGFFEDDSLGQLWMVLGLVFLFRALKSPELKKENFINAALAGLFFSIMAWSWNYFLIVPFLLLGYFVFAAVNFYARHSMQELKAFITLFFTAFAITAVGATLKFGLKWIELIIYNIGRAVPSAGGSGLFIAGFGLIIFALFAFLIFSGAKKEESKTKSTLAFISMAVLYLIFLISLIALADPTGYFHSVLPSGGIFGATVGEESPGAPNFGYKYNALLPFAFLALLLIPFMVFREKERHAAIFAFFWIAVTMILAFYKLKYTFIFGLPIAVGSGIVVAEFFHYFQNRFEWESKIVAFALGFLLLTGIAAGANFMPKNVPHIESVSSDWKPALEWLKSNTPKDAKIFNWWDEGHWISFLGERKVFLDNRNADVKGNTDFAKFTITTDFNEALGIARKYRPDYLIVDRDLWSGMTSFMIYAYETIDFGSNPELAQLVPGYFGVYFQCSPSGSQLNCGPNVLPVEQANSFLKQWSSNPSTIYQNRTPLWYYMDEDNSAFFVGAQNVNDSAFSKIWFHHPDAEQFFEEVYHGGDVKIFRIKPELYSGQ